LADEISDEVCLRAQDSRDDLVPAVVGVQAERSALLASPVRDASRLFSCREKKALWIIFLNAMSNFLNHQRALV
jgi:hypothetical protein